MSRWSPDARGRLEQAAYELFLEYGYERVTVADIATRAGLTERTFFRHFSDKREVLFGGAVVLQTALLQSLASVSPDRSPFAAVRSAIESIAALSHWSRDQAQQRMKLLATHADLQERELIKRATLTASLAQALRERGTPEPAASLAADMAIAVFYVGFNRWLDDAAKRDFLTVVSEGFDELRSVASGA